MTKREALAYAEKAYRMRRSRVGADEDVDEEMRYAANVAFRTVKLIENPSGRNTPWRSSMR